MTVPSSIDDLDPVAGLNYPLGGEDVFPQLDNYLRAHASFIAQLRASRPVNFTDLDDTPASLDSSSLKVVRVNIAGTALEFTSAGKMPIVNVSASRAIVDSDMGCNLLCDSASAMTLTFPTNAGTPIDVESLCVVTQWGAGQVTLAGASGVTLRAPGALVKTRAQFSQITAMKVAADEWLIGGDRD